MRLLQSRISTGLSRASSVAVLVAGIVLLAGCSQAIKPKPFADFAASIQELRGGVDKAATLIGSWSRDRELARVAASTPDDALERVQGLQLSMGTTADGDDDPSAWTSTHELLFLKIDRFRRGFYMLNSGLASYGGACKTLADRKLVDPAAFDQMRKDLNSNLREAGKALDINEVMVREEPFRVDGFALFATLSTEISRLVIEQARRRRIVELVRKHQPQVEAAAELGRQGVHALGLALWQEYIIKSDTLARSALGRRVDGQPDAAATPASRQRAVEDLLALNQRFTTELEALDSMERAYSRLGAAHADLAASVEGSGIALRDVLDAAKRIHAAYEELRKANAQ